MYLWRNDKSFPWNLYDHSFLATFSFQSITLQITFFLERNTQISTWTFVNRKNCQHFWFYMNLKIEFCYTYIHCTLKNEIHSGSRFWVWETDSLKYLAALITFWFWKKNKWGETFQNGKLFWSSLFFDQNFFDWV